MSLLHKTVLSPEQCKIFPVLREARKRGFYLVGGTAIALHLGHRKSIDFDLFRDTSFYTETVSKILIKAKAKLSSVHQYKTDNVTGIIDGVKITFFYFPFAVKATIDFEEVIKIPDLLTLAAMKAYALGRRAKWKDYVDLYFLLRDHFSVEEIGTKALEIFEGNFNTKLFREQLCYFDYINYDEAVEYLISNPPSDDEVKRFLIEKAIED
jgi:hypothetical protein